MEAAGRNATLGASRVISERGWEMGVRKTNMILYVVVVAMALPCLQCCAGKGACGTGNFFVSKPDLFGRDGEVVVLRGIAKNVREGAALLLEGGLILLPDYPLWPDEKLLAIVHMEGTLGIADIQPDRESLTSADYLSDEGLPVATRGYSLPHLVGAREVSARR